MQPDINLIKKRIAYIAIGSSTLRNQGAAGVAKTAQEYLMKLDLSFLKGILNEGEYAVFLDKHTEELKDLFPGQAKGNWGAARKAINVFIEEAFYNKYLNAEYNLEKLGPFLEIPIDSHVIKNMKKEIEDGIIPKWSSIKSLKKEENHYYQLTAKKIADRKGKWRIFLDLDYWRNETAKL